MTPTQAAEASTDPRFSIIVPAFRVEAYLRDCLDSVLSQSFGDFEVIAVNDASPDACGDIMDEYAAADPRVLTVQLEQNVGLGRARNAGMARARGTYLIFLDSDDTMLPGALQAIARRLDETGDPDLLVFDYSRTHWDGRISPNAKRSVLTESPRDTFRLDDKPELLGLLQVAWNKAYRRDFVERWGFVYPTGYYEDTPWTYPVLVAAETIAVLDRVCVHYRQRRQGSILSSASRKHFDVFDQYELVFAFLADHPEFERWHGALFERMTTHLRVIDNSPGRLPDDARAEFHARRVEAERAHRPADYREPQNGRRPSLARRAARRLPGPLRSAARGAVRRARKARRAPSRLRTPLRTAVLKGYYRAQRMLPVKDDVAVFAAYWNTDYACNPAAVHQKLLELAPEIRTTWVLKRGSRNAPPPGTTVVHPGSFGFWRAMARGKYFVNNVNFPTTVVKRRGQVHVQTHHGTPLKRMGVDLVEFPLAQGNLDMKTLMQRVDRWDYSVSSNSFTTAIWERAYPAAYTSLDYGYPRNDILVNATDEDRKRAREKLGLAPDAKVVLYAPTHRDYQAVPRPLLDLEHFAGQLGEDFTVLSRAHYFNLGTGPGAADGSPIVDVSGHPSVEELYLAADCLLTDYSSLMFDYALLDRPIVIFANDWEVYRATRGTYFDIHVASPGHVAATEEDLLDVFLSGRWSDDSSAKARAEFRRRFCEYDDGRAAERLVRRVFLNQEQNQEHVPQVALSSERPPRPARGQS